MKSVLLHVWQAARLNCLAFLVLVAGASQAAVVRWGYVGPDWVPLPQNLTNLLAVSAGDQHAFALRTDGTVVGWGTTNYGVLNAPFGLSNVASIAAGGYHTLARKSDGTVVAWGAGTAGQSGNYQCGQSQVPAGLANVTSIAAGILHSLAVKSDGTVAAWGWSGFGGVGPTNVPAGLSGVVAVAGRYASMALKSDGTVVAWGQAPGNSGPVNVTVPPGVNNVIAIGLGTFHAVALKSDGTVISWGLNENAAGWTNVPAGLSGVTAIAANENGTLALRNDGTVVAWGSGTATPAISGITAISLAPTFSLGYGPGAAIAPQLVQRPSDLVVATGTNAVFQVEAEGGAAALNFQWRFNGVPIVSATNAVLTISNASAIHAGNYSVSVSNSLGVTQSETVKLIVRASNDNFTDALEIPSAGGRTLISNSDATKEPSEPNHAGNRGGASVWFTWTAPMTGTVTIDTIGCDFDTLLAVYVGNSLPNLSLIAADDDGANFHFNSKLSFAATSGSRYQIAVDGYEDDRGSVVLNVTLSQPLVSLPGLTGDGLFRFQANGPSNRKVIVEASIDLIAWAAISTNQLSEAGLITFVDPSSTNQAHRFFRLRLE